jgi:hypothetical protein
MLPVQYPRGQAGRRREEAKRERGWRKGRVGRGKVMKGCDRFKMKGMRPRPLLLGTMLQVSSIKSVTDKSRETDQLMHVTRDATMTHSPTYHTLARIRGEMKG